MQHFFLNIFVCNGERNKERNKAVTGVWSLRAVTHWVCTVGCTQTAAASLHSTMKWNVYGRKWQLDDISRESPHGRRSSCSRVGVRARLCVSRCSLCLYDSWGLIISSYITESNRHTHVHLTQRDWHKYVQTVVEASHTCWTMNVPRLFKCHMTFDITFLFVSMK